MIGRADLLRQIPSRESDRWRGVDLSKLIAPASSESGEPAHAIQDRNDRPGTALDDRILEDLDRAWEDGTPFRAHIRSTTRTAPSVDASAGASRRSTVTPACREGSIKLHFTGSAGQSFGSWLVPGVRLRLVGEANDYVAKGMTGGEITIRAPGEAGFEAHDATLVGNTVLYGATAEASSSRAAPASDSPCATPAPRTVVEGVGDTL